MSVKLWVLPIVCCTAVSAAHPQSLTSSPTHSVELSLLAGHLDYGTYFTGPGGVQFSNDDGLGYGAQLSVRIWRNVSVVGSVLHGRSNWRFEEVPFVGLVTINGARLWLFDVGPRVTVPLGSTIPLALPRQRRGQSTTPSTIPSSWARHPIWRLAGESASSLTWASAPEYRLW
jgi:hypothetical protein